MIAQRYFRATEQVYETIRASLDAQWGHGPTSGTMTCFEPSATAPKDSQGRLLLAVRAVFCDYAAVAAVLPGLLASGAVEEITAAEYAQAE